MTAEYQAIMDLLERSEGEITPELAERLESLSGDLPHKLERLCEVWETFNAQAAGLQAALDRLGKQHSAATRSRERLREYMQRAMEAFGERKLRAGNFTLALWKNSTPTAEWHGRPEDLPERYRRVKIEFDRLAAARDYRDGLPLPDGVTVIEGQHLRIQ